MRQEDDNYGSKEIGGSKNLEGTDWGGRTWKLMRDRGGCGAIQRNHQTAWELLLLLG